MTLVNELIGYQKVCRYNHSFDANMVCNFPSLIFIILYPGFGQHFQGYHPSIMHIRQVSLQLCLTSLLRQYWLLILHFHNGQISPQQTLHEAAHFFRVHPSGALHLFLRTFFAHLLRCQTFLQLQSALPYFLPLIIRATPSGGFKVTWLKMVGFPRGKNRMWIYYYKKVQAR